MNHIWSCILITLIGIAGFISFYRNKEKSTLFELGCAFGEVFLLGILLMNLLLYLSPPVQESFEIINNLYPIHLIIIGICSLGIIALSIAKWKIKQLVFVGIIVGTGIFAWNLWYFIHYADEIKIIFESTGEIGSVISRLDNLIIVLSTSILFTLIATIVLVYVTALNWQNFFNLNKKTIKKVESKKKKELNNSYNDYSLG